MQRKTVRGLRGATVAALLVGSASQAAPAAPGQAAPGSELEAVKRELAEQRVMIDELRRELARAAKRAGPQAVGADELGSRRGTGNPAGPDAAPPVAGAGTAPPPAAQAGLPAEPVGQQPRSAQRPPEVAPLFEQPGVLTPRGKFVLEPSLQFGYSSNNRVALVGYTVIPALLVGLIDVREVRRSTLTGALALRTGLSNRLELEVRAPYVYRSDSAVSRELFTGTSAERAFDTSGKALGDAEVATRYQLNSGTGGAYYVAGLRFKSRTGRDPFEVITDCTTRCVGENASGSGLPLQLPTGSGFYSVQPSLTWLFASDPAVFFGSISYLHNFARRNVSRLVLAGEREFIGDIKAGDIAGFNFGMGLALNDKASLSLGYDHSSIGRTVQNGVPVPGSVRTQLGTLLMGFSYRLSNRYTVNVSVGAGLTRDTPDVSLSLRLPATF